MTGAEFAAGSKRPTIRDVAVRANVSKSLVSLVYSAPDSVSPARKQRVLDAAAELGFRPNHIARSLSGVRDDVIGILVADPRNPVFDEVVEAAREEFERAGRLGLMTSAVRPGTGEPELDVDVVSMIADLRPSRLLVVGSVPEMNRIARGVGSTRIIVASAFADDVDVASVRGDDARGIRLVVEHLAQLGHTRIAHIAGGEFPVALQRARAFAEALAERGLESRGVIGAGFTERDGYRATASLLDGDDPPTAIVAVNDLSAIGAMTAIRERGLAGRVAVTGYDNTYLAALGPIALTSVEPGNAEIGRRSARLLLRTSQPPHEVLIAPRLVVRSSTQDIGRPDDRHRTNR
jgi:DNA-binding LacI/PurR family transcriptional regulator